MIDEVVDAMPSLSEAHADEYLYDALRRLKQHHPDSPNIVWMLGGEIVCRQTWCAVFQVGVHRIKRLLKHLDAGHLNAPSFADELAYELQKHGLSVPKLRLEAQSVASFTQPHEATLWLGWVVRAKILGLVAFAAAGPRS